METSRNKEDMKDLFVNLSKDFHELVNNKQQLRAATEKFLNNLIDELTLGIIFDAHRKAKTKAVDLDGEADGVEIERGVDIEIFSQYTIKKPQDCVCPYCDRAVAATRFAPHLDKCMICDGNRRQKNSVRLVVVNNSTNEQENSVNENSYRDSGASDNEDDVDWSPGDKRRKKRKERNGKKRSKGTPKKVVDNDYMDTLNVDVEADDQDLTNLRDLLKDHSNCSSPADSTGSNRSGSSGGRKKEKSKSKKGKRDRSSPCSSSSSLY